MLYALSTQISLAINFFLKLTGGIIIARLDDRKIKFAVCPTISTKSRCTQE